MKKKIIVIATILFSIFCSINIVHALYNGGSSSGIPASGGGSCGFNFTLCGNQAGKSTGYDNDFAAVRLRLVYYDGTNMTQVPGSRDYYVVRDYVVTGWSSDFNCRNRSDCETQPRDYTRWFLPGGYNSTNIKTDICGPDCTDEDRLNSWLQKMGVSRESLNQYSCGADGTGNCMYEAGYRILIEPVLHYRLYGHSYFNTLKAIANLANTNSYSNSDNWIDLNYLLRTDFDDVGITRANGKIWDGYQAQQALANFNSGYGYNIIDITNALPDNYEYTVDAACTNCQDTTSNGSFIIQDINNWEAIEASNRYNGDNTNIRTYYYKNDNTYCREEIKVDFPDTSKVINVQTGRYFTVGASKTDIGYSLDKNFGDISVTRTRECQGAGATSYTQSHPFGTQTEAEGTVDNGTGIVTLKYTENILNGSQYDKDEITLIAKDCQESINAGTRTMTCKYGLPNYVYRYVKDGQSLYDGRNDSSTIDLGIPNLPISFNNYSTPRATVQLAYELPNDSQLKKSYIKDNTYLNSGDVDNIYKKYIEGSMNGESDQNELNKSACAKLYGGTNTAGFRVCAQNRTNNKIGNDSSSNCVTRNTLSSGNLSERYICPITGNDENGKICEYDSIADIYYGKNGTAVSKEQFDKECDGSPNDKICKYDDSTDTYYGKNGTVVSQEQYYEQCPQECTVINGVYYGKMNSDGTGRKVTQDVYAEECLKYCTIETVNGQTIYYDLQGNASTDPNVEGGYNDDCVSKVTCPPEQCEYGCCPDGSCADSEGNCPFTTPGNNIIYRPIDLINPFPSQNAMIRATGSNWCAYNIRTNKIDCSADNAIVKAHINNNRSTDDYDIYSSEPLYEVVLTPDTIKAVRNYNNRQEKAGGYGDYTLNCNGTVGCYSTFLREEGIVSFSGECSKLGSLKTCAERR